MEGTSNFEQKKTAEDAFSQAELKSITIDWRKKIHYRDKNFNRFVHIALVGGPNCGKSSTITSIFRSLYPALAEKTPANKVPREEPGCYHLTKNIFYWKIPSFTDSLERTKKQFEGDGEEIPKFNVACLLLQCADLKDEKYINQLKELFEFFRTKDIPFYIYVVKVDLVPPQELNEKFERLTVALSTDKIPVSKELLMPVKNHQTGRISLLLDYFFLRVLDRTLSAIEFAPEPEFAVEPKDDFAVPKHDLQTLTDKSTQTDETCFSMDIEKKEEKSE